MRWTLAALVLTATSCTRATSSTDVDAPLAANDARGPAHDAPIAGDGPAAIADAATACKQPNLLHGDGHHNAGMDCMGGCHDHGFSVAGTLYLADGVTPASDATVTVVDANHSSQDLIVSTNGNFFSFLPVTYPITLTASLCPSTQMMVEHPTAGGCNAGACHAPGGTQGVAHL